MIDLESKVIHDKRILRYSGPFTTSRVVEPLLISSLNLSLLVTNLRAQSFLMEAWMHVSI